MTIENESEIFAVIRLEYKYRAAYEFDYPRTHEVEAVNQFALDRETYEALQLWRIQQENAAAKDIAFWLENNGGVLHSNDDNPAYVTIVQGHKIEDWYKLGRKVSSMTTHKNGDKEESHYDSNGELHSKNGKPAVIETSGKGATRMLWYNHGKFVKEAPQAGEERPADLGKIAGVQLVMAP